MGDNSTVQITIQVVDANSQQVLQGVETKLLAVGSAGEIANRQFSGFGAALAGVPLAKFEGASVGAGDAVGKMATSFGLAGANLGVFGTSIQSTAQGLAGFGNAAIRTGNDVEDASKKTERLHGNMREVSGTARELGVNMGYSMRRFLAESPQVMNVLRAMSTAFVAMAAVDIAVQLAEGAEKLYEKWFDVDKAVEQYTEKAREAAQEKLLFDTGSIETTASMLGQIGDELDRLEAKRAAFDKLFDVPGTNINLPGAGMLQYGQYLDPLVLTGIKKPTTFSAGDDAQEAKLAEMQKKGQEHLLNSTDKVAEQKLQGQQAYNQAVDQGYAKIDSHEKDAIALINQRYGILRANEADLAKTAGIRPTDLDKTYSAEQKAEVARAHQESSGQRIALARQENEQIIQMQNAATNAGVRGEALYAEQAQQAIDKISRGHDSEKAKLAEKAALEMQYHNAKMQRIDDENHATLKLQQQAQAAGLTGIPKLEQDRQSSLNEVEYLANQGAFADPATAGHRRAAIDQQTNAQIAEARQQFNEKIQQMEQSSDAQMTSGYARFAAQEKQSLTELAKAYSEFYGDDQNKWQGYQDAKLQIERNTDRQRQQYAQQINEQITETEAQAARALLPPWQASLAAIQDQYRQRFDKARQELKQGAIDEQQYNREIVAAGAMASAEMQKQAMQTRDQIAGQLEGLFSNPAEYMQRRAKQMMMDVLANWVEQLMQASPRMQGLLGGLLGMNPVGTNPRTGILDAFGAHKAQPMSETMGMPASQLTTAGTTLSSAGATLSTSGTMLMDAASQIATAMQEWSSMNGGGSGVPFSNPLSSGGFGGLGGGTGFNGLGSMPSMGAPSMGGGDSTPSVAGVGGGLTGAFSMASTASGAASIVPGASNAIQQGLQLSSVMRGALGNLGGTAPLLNPNGGFQPTDIAPTNAAGVLGTVPNSSPESPASSTSGIAGGFGMASGLLAGGMGLFGAFEGGYNSTSFAGGLMSMASGAMSGAAIGSMFAPGIGTIAGAAAGAMVGLLGDLFGDHGASKAKKYNIETVIPGLQKAMDGFSFGGSSYDSAAQNINNLQIQAMQQCKQFGSGAWDYYKNSIVPEIQQAQAQVDREGAGGRSMVKMNAAQFDSGGIVSSFGDFSTGPFSGFIHARVGERVMNPMASMMHGPMLDAMNAGASTLNRMSKTAPLGSGGGDVHHHHYYNINALDTKSLEAALRNGAGATIQTHLNQSAGKYAGKALNGSR